MNTLNSEISGADGDEIVEVDAFTTSIAPVNHTEKFIFSLRDRLCCVGLLAVGFVILRFVFSN